MLIKIIYRKNGLSPRYSSIKIRPPFYRMSVTVEGRSMLVIWKEKVNESTVCSIDVTLHHIIGRSFEKRPLTFEHFLNIVIIIIEG
jgi:hypothetical protein